MSKLNFISESDFKVLEDNVRAGRSLPGKSKYVVPDGASAAPSPKFRSKWESAYASKLDLELRAGLIKAYWYEPMSFKLSKGKRFRPDYLIQYPDGLEQRLEFVEIKGPWFINRRDSLTHLKWCAQLYPCFVWRVAVRTKGGGWDHKYVEV